MTRLTLCIPFYNQLQDAKGPVGTFRYNTSDKTEWMIIDNGSTDPVEEFVFKFLRPKRVNYIRNEQNQGMLKTLQQAYENCETEVLALTHNDVLIYEKNWDERILSYFRKMPKLGGVGFFGAQGCSKIGERIQEASRRNVRAGMSNMLEAEKHGQRMDKEYRSAAIFDGFFMAFRMEMLKKAGGFDQRYHYHHIYDRDASLESLRHGYKNIVVNVPCHHLSGLTANRSEYQEWVNNKTESERGEKRGDLWTHDENTKIFRKKWESVLPIFVEDDFTYRNYSVGGWEFKGDAICKMEN